MDRLDKVLWNKFQYYETDQLKEILESMSAKGYMFRKIIGNVLIFNSTPNNFKYKVLCKRKCNKEIPAEAVNHGDWNLVIENKHLLIFRSKVQSNPLYNPDYEKDKYEFINKERKHDYG